MNLIESFRHNERWTSLACHALLLAMMVTAGLGFIRFGGFLVPGWERNGVLLVTGLVSLEALVSYRIVRGLSPLESNKLFYWLGEWVVIVILVKCFTELRFGIPFFLADLAQLSVDFIPAFFTGDFLLNLTVVFLVWLFTTSFARDLAALEGDVDLLREVDVPINRSAVHRSILNRVLMLGLLLVLLAAVMRQDRFPDLNPSPASLNDIAFVFIYFLLGLVLLSLTNFASLRATWSIEKAVIQRDLASHWILYAVIFLVGLTGLAALLPTRYSVGLLDALAYLISLIVFAFQLILSGFVLVYLLIEKVLAALFRLLGGDTTSPDLNPGFNIQQFLQRSPQAASPAWLEVAKTLIFWVVLAGLVVYALVQFVKQHRSLTEMATGSRLWQWLAAVSRWLRDLFQHASASVRASIQAGVQRLGSRRAARKPKERWNLINLRRLTPRQRVLFYYHALVRRAGERGVSRRPWMTPSEFSQTLKSELASQGESVSTITDAFIEARYSQHEVPEEFATRVKAAWNRIRSMLRNRRA